MRDAALLLTSELVSNAVLHGGGPVRLSVDDGAARVRIEVADAGQPLPGGRGSQRPDEDEGGRGLQLVEALASSWGSRAEPGGKVVWFELEHVPTPTGAALSALPQQR